MVMLTVATTSSILDSLSVLFAFIALILSLLTFILYFFEYRTDKKEKNNNKAPILIFSNIKYQIAQYKFPEPYLKPNDSQFILEKRNFILDEEGKSVLEGPEISLIIDACPSNSKAKKIDFINMNKITVANIGFDAVYIVIKRITIKKHHGDPIIVNPSTQNKIFKRITQSEPLVLYVSIISNSESGIYDFPKAEDKKFLAQKLQEIAGEVLNTRLEVSADLWSEIIIEVESKNSFNVYYSQELIFKIEDNTYLADQTEPKLIKKNNYKRFKKFWK